MSTLTNNEKVCGEYTVQKEHRLSKREDFTKVYRQGKSVANHQFVLYYKKRQAKPGEEPPFRLGISVSKKLGNAVVRNRLRRIMKEIVRLHADQVATGFDLILIARKPAAELDYAEMERSILHVLKRASLCRKKTAES